MTRYSPFSFVATTAGPAGEAGELTVMVAPGSTAPDSSFTVPIRLPVSSPW